MQKLIPNEFAGYRIKPDYYNWTVVVLKKHGITSKSAGEIYETPMGYYKSIELAFKAIYELESRQHAEAAEKEGAASNPEFSYPQALVEAFKAGEAAVKQTAQLFEQDLKNAGLNLHELAKHFKIPGADSTDNSPA